MAKSGKSKADHKAGRDRAAGAPPKGPCRTCNNSPECVYRRQRGYDVIQCELYDGFAVPAERVVDLAHTATGREKPETVRSFSEEPSEGLCVNCGRAGGCNLPRPAGGVWHCQEYT